MDNVYIVNADTGEPQHTWRSQHNLGRQPFPSTLLQMGSFLLFSAAHARRAGQRMSPLILLPTLQ